MVEIILSVIALLILILLIWALAEPHMPQFTVIRMNKDRNTSLRVLFFSDIHSEYCFIKPSYITSLIRRESTSGIDAVVFGGDITGDPSKLARGTEYLQEIAGCCRELNIPFLGVTGNHDCNLTKEQEDRCGFINIENTYVEIKGHVIAGIDDSGRLERRWYDPADLPAGKEHILIAHDPDALLHLTDPDNIDYMLSGHIHGGQIRTPFKVEFLVIRKDELPRQGIYAGVHRIGKTKVFISRGVGCVKLPLRFFARPEISIVEF